MIGDEAGNGTARRADDCGAVSRAGACAESNFSEREDSERAEGRSRTAAFAMKALRKRAFNSVEPPVALVVPNENGRL